MTTLANERNLSESLLKFGNRREIDGSETCQANCSSCLDDFELAGSLLEVEVEVDFDKFSFEEAPGVEK